MQLSASRILTTHVGSLPRPPELEAMLLRREKHELDASRRRRAQRSHHGGFGSAEGRAIGRAQSATRCLGAGGDLPHKKPVPGPRKHPNPSRKCQTRSLTLTQRDKGPGK